MDNKKLIPIISMVSVLIMFAWGYLAGSFEHSWPAVFAGGIVIAALSIINKNKPKDREGKDE